MCCESMFTCTVLIHLLLYLLTHTGTYIKQILSKPILACLGAQMGSIHEKNRGRKSFDTAPLNARSRNLH